MAECALCAFGGMVESLFAAVGVIRSFLLSSYGFDRLSRQSLSHAYEALLTSYTGDTGKGVFPVESVYRPWTEDSSCLLPFSFSRGYLNGDAAMHLRAILSDLGIDEE